MNLLNISDIVSSRMIVADINTTKYGNEYPTFDDNHILWAANIRMQDETPLLQDTSFQNEEMVGIDIR